jgi:hypothetical protein
MFESILLKVDELDGSLRLFYENLKDYVEATGKDHHETYSFSQREIRQALNISKTQLHRYLRALMSSWNIYSFPAVMSTKALNTRSAIGIISISSGLK